MSVGSSGSSTHPDEALKIVLPTSSFTALRLFYGQPQQISQASHVVLLGGVPLLWQREQKSMLLRWWVGLNYRSMLKSFRGMEHLAFGGREGDDQLFGKIHSDHDDDDDDDDDEEEQYDNEVDSMFERYLHDDQSEGELESQFHNSVSSRPPSPTIEMPKINVVDADESTLNQTFVTAEEYNSPLAQPGVKTTLPRHPKKSRVQFSKVQFSFNEPVSAKSKMVALRPEPDSALAPMPIEEKHKFALKSLNAISKVSSRALYGSMKNNRRVANRIRSKFQAGEVIKMEKMLILIKEMRSPSAFSIFTEFEPCDTRVLERWKEYILVARSTEIEERPILIQLYTQHTIPATLTEKTYHKRDTYDFYLDKSTLVGWYNQQDKSISIVQGQRVYILLPQTSKSSIQWLTLLSALTKRHKRRHELKLSIPDVKVELNITVPSSIAQLPKPQNLTLDFLPTGYHRENTPLVEFLDNHLRHEFIKTGFADLAVRLKGQEFVLGFSWRWYDRLEWVGGDIIGDVLKMRVLDVAGGVKGARGVLEVRRMWHYPTSVKIPEQLKDGGQLLTGEEIIFNLLNASVPTADVTNPQTNGKFVSTDIISSNNGGDLIDETSESTLRQSKHQSPSKSSLDFVGSESGGVKSNDSLFENPQNPTNKNDNGIDPPDANSPRDSSSQIILEEPAPIEGFLSRLSSNTGSLKKGPFRAQILKFVYVHTSNNLLFLTQSYKALPPSPYNPNIDSNLTGLKVANYYSDFSSGSLPSVYHHNPYPLDGKGHIDWLTPHMKEFAKRDRFALWEYERRCANVLRSDGVLDMTEIESISEFDPSCVPLASELTNSIAWGKTVSQSELSESRKQCYFQIKMKTGMIVVLRAPEGMREEWMSRLVQLHRYWTLRIQEDLRQLKRIKVKNIKRLNIDDYEDSNPLLNDWENIHASADPSIHNITPSSMYRPVIRSGYVFQRPKKHSSFRKLFLILIPGFLKIYKVHTKNIRGVVKSTVWHTHYMTIPITECYVYSGNICELDLLEAPKHELDSGVDPGRNSLPRVYNDGWFSSDDELERCFTLWFGRKRTIAGDGVDVGSGRNPGLIRMASRLGVTGKSMVFMCRSRQEKELWVGGLNVMLDRFGLFETETFKASA